MLRAYLCRSTILTASRNVQISIPLVRYRFSPYCADTSSGKKTKKPTVGKIVLKNVRELAAHLLSTARDHDHIESRLQAIRHAFIRSSENLSVPVTVVGNDQWFYSWLETARANEKEKIFPIRVDKSLNPKSTVDLVPVLTEKLERIFQSLHADDAASQVSNELIHSKCAQEAKGIAERLQLTNSVQENMVKILLNVLKGTWEASANEQPLKEAFTESFTQALLANSALCYHINAVGQIFPLLNLIVSPELDKEMQEQTQKRLQLYQTTSNELQGLIENHVALKTVKDSNKYFIKMRKDDITIAPETDPLYITLFCNKATSKTAQAAAPSESGSEFESEEVAESDSPSSDSGSLSPEQPQPSTASLSGRTSLLRQYTPLANSALFKIEHMDTTRFTRSKGIIVIDNLPHGVVNHIVLSKALGGITLKSCKIFKYPTFNSELKPPVKLTKKAKTVKYEKSSEYRKLSESLRTDNYAVIELADAFAFNRLLHEAVRIFGVVIMGQSCNVHPMDELNRFIIELPEPAVAKEVLTAMRKILRGHFSIETMQGIPHPRRKDRNSAPVDNKERVLLCNFEFESNDDAFDAFQLFVKKLKRSLKLSSPLLPPLWLSSNRAKEDRALHARLKDSLERIRIKAQQSLQQATTTPTTGNAVAVTDTTKELPPTNIDSETSTASTSLDSRVGAQISLIVN